MRAFGILLLLTWVGNPWVIGLLVVLGILGMFLPILHYVDGYGFTYGARISFVDRLGPRSRAPRLAIAVSVLVAAGFVLIGDLTLIASVTDLAIYVVFIAVNSGNDPKAVEGYLAGVKCEHGFGLEELCGHKVRRVQLFSLLDDLDSRCGSTGRGSSPCQWSRHARSACQTSRPWRPARRWRSGASALMTTIGSFIPLAACRIQACSWPYCQVRSCPSPMPASTWCMPAIAWNTWWTHASRYPTGSGW